MINFTYTCVFSSCHLIFPSCQIPTIDIDECTLGISNCGHSSMCLNTIGSFSCHCANGYIHNISSGCHAMPNVCSDGMICDKNAICKHIGGPHVSNTIGVFCVLILNLYTNFKLNGFSAVAKLGLVAMVLCVHQTVI